jgi:microcystin-dependent protein
MKKVSIFVSSVVGTLILSASQLNANADECLLGEVKQYAGGFVPKNYALCDGTELNMNHFQALYSIVRNNYGGDPRRASFKLPNLNNRNDLGKKVVNIICINGTYPQRP